MMTYSERCALLSKDIIRNLKVSDRDITRVCHLEMKIKAAEQASVKKYGYLVETEELKQLWSQVEY